MARGHRTSLRIVKGVENIGKRTPSVPRETDCRSKRLSDSPRVSSREFRRGWKMSANGLYRTLNTDFKNGELENGDCREMDFHFSE